MSFGRYSMYDMYFNEVVAYVKNNPDRYIGIDGADILMFSDRLDTTKVLDANMMSCIEIGELGEAVLVKVQPKTILCFESGTQPYEFFEPRMQIMNNFTWIWLKHEVK